MNALMAELAPYILAGLFGLVGWYLRDNARRHQALVDAVNGIPATIANLEQKLEGMTKFADEVIAPLGALQG